MLETGSLIDGKYRVLRVVGRGGMSVVYQAVNEKENKIWAIKEVRKENIRSSEGLRQNLSIETEYLKKLDHPNLPKIVEVIDTEEAVLIVMDYIEGNTLMKAIEETGAQDQDKAVGWALQLCDVLGYLHSRVPPIIYRDLKPSNVMLKPDGTIMLIDFGTAREFNSANSEDSAWFGTQGYAAPEQYGGHGQTDERTDIYCLGATLYHLVTGHNPGKPPYEMVPIRHWDPLLSSGLEKIILKCTQRDPRERYADCAELAVDLRQFRKLNTAYMRLQDTKWKTFLICLMIAVIAAVCALGFKIGEISARTSAAHEVTISEENSKEAESSDNESVKRSSEQEGDRQDKSVQTDGGGMMETYQILQIGFYVCLAAAGVFFIGGIYLFLRFDIRSILSEKSGQRKEKAIKELREDYRAGRTHRQTDSTARSTGKKTDSVTKGVLEAPRSTLPNPLSQSDNAVASYSRRAVRIDESIEPSILDCPTVRLDAVDSSTLVQSATIPEVENVRFEIVRKTVCRSTDELIT